MPNRGNIHWWILGVVGILFLCMACSAIMFVTNAEGLWRLPWQESADNNGDDEIVNYRPTPEPGDGGDYRKDPSNPTAVPEVEQIGEKQEGCDVVAVSDFSDRGTPQVSVNDQPHQVALTIRGKGDCPRALWDDETGVDVGKNYKFTIPAGFGIVVPATTTAVYLPEGNLGEPFDVTETAPMIVAVGPLQIDIGVYEGFPRLFPIEWVDDGTAWLWPIHSEEVVHGGGTPELIFIDSNGVIRNADPGMITDSFVRANLP